MSDFAEPLQQIDRTYVLWRGRRLSYFAGCDYLRLSSHPEVLDAVRSCLDDYGLNVSASRITTGNHRVYVALEKAVRKFFQSDAVIIASTGYFTNVIASQGLRGSIDHVFIDEHAHGSLRDAATTLGCKITSFKHRDAEDLKKKVATRIPRSKVAVLTDGMFSHNGAVAPLADYRAVIGPTPLLWVDDAHAAGVSGDGRGTIASAGLNRRNILQTVTFSKAFGTYGGAILCDKVLASRISDRSAAVAGNTPMPLPLACATLKSLALCNKSLREKLLANVHRFWNAYGTPDPANLSPIISFAPPNPEVLRRRLLTAGIYPPLIKYPGGPRHGYFRFAVSSEHSPAQIETLAGVLAQANTPPL
ncbi:MAG TPA: pyridoxal phosphate-dependent aminotransferase family protein [Candidatus Kapabacteria bacterium]|nr:pyridoxal phosphate-dependent aminotransferase family protein [Candidatus Kapabacteria bacterium]